MAAPDSTLDSDLIAASAATLGEFATIFDRHFDPIFGYLQRRIGRDLAEELAAETFAVAFAGRERYDTERGDARPWLFGIATNLLRRHQRREVRELRAYARSANDPVLDAFEGIEERIDASGERRRLTQALARLSPTERDVLLLAAWAELSYIEIAEALEVPVGTVRSRLSRARSHLASHLHRPEEITDAVRAEGA